jgi:hypothetical protein
VYRQDYVLRLIEQLGRALRAFRDRILRQEVAEADLRATITEVAQQAGIDLDVARRLDPASLLMWLAPTGDIDEPRIWLVAELLHLSGRHGADAAPTAGRGDLLRALALFQRLDPQWRASDGFPTAGERADEVRRLLDTRSRTASDGV